MSIFTYHLVKTSISSSLRLLFFSMKSKNIKGLIHAEKMIAMTLGSPIFSPKRMLFKEVVIFAQWESELDIDNFLNDTKIGITLSKGWHTRLTFVRQWGKLAAFNLTNIPYQINENAPVVAVTIARMKFLAIPRFLKWGRQVEQLVRDHPGTTLSLASIRFPNTISTFSIWKKESDMLQMVHGHSNVPQPKRHSAAMKERDRKDFHFEFTTLRFIPISEFGEWNGKSNLIPFLIKEN
jgi:hypothetical protein